MCHRRNLFKSKLTVSMTSLKHVGLESAKKQGLFENRNISWSDYKEVTQRHQITLDLCIYKYCCTHVKIIEFDR